MLSSAVLKKELKDLKKKHDVRVYTPLKYFKGLTTLKDVETRFRRIVKSDSYKPFSTDEKMKTKTSKYTSAFYKMYPKSRSLKSKSEATGVPYDIIKKVYNKGMAAWKTGHRPGATQQQWGYARVHSFLMLGCAAYTADKHLVHDAIKTMKKSDVKAWLTKKSLCPNKEINLRVL